LITSIFPTKKTSKDFSLDISTLFLFIIEMESKEKGKKEPSLFAPSLTK